MRVRTVREETPVQVGLRLVSRRSRTEAEIEQALVRREFSRSDVLAGLGRLRDLGYIDDAKLASERSRLLQQRGHGTARIRRDLENRGVSSEIVAGVLPEPEGERLIVRRLLEVRFPEGVPVQAKERARAARFLAGRGFLPETIHWALRLRNEGHWHEG